MVGNNNCKNMYPNTTTFFILLLLKHVSIMAAANRGKSQK